MHLASQLSSVNYAITGREVVYLVLVAPVINGPSQFTIVTLCRSFPVPMHIRWVMTATTEPLLAGAGELSTFISKFQAFFPAWEFISKNKLDQPAFLRAIKLSPGRRWEAYQSLIILLECHALHKSHWVIVRCATITACLRMDHTVYPSTILIVTSSLYRMTVRALV